MDGVRLEQRSTRLEQIRVFLRRGLHRGAIDVEDSGQGITHQDVCMLTKVTGCWTLFLFSSRNGGAAGFSKMRKRSPKRCHICPRAHSLVLGLPDPR